MTMNTTSKLMMGYAIIIFSFGISLVYSQNENAICSQLQSVTQLCSGNNNNHYTTSITTGVPGKRGPKGEKGDSSTYVTNEEKIRRFSSKLASLHVQLTSIQDENRLLKAELDETKEIYSNETQRLKADLEETKEIYSNETQRLKADLEETKEIYNNKIIEVEDRIMRILSKGYDEERLKTCGLLRAPSNIENSRFSASSSWSDELAPYKGRLFASDRFWHSAHSELENQWLQVDLKQNRTIYGIVTQGRPDLALEYWTKSYTVSYKSDINESFHDIQDESGSTKVFQGNTDGNTPVVNDFAQPINARYFRINVLTYENYPVLRLDFLTC